MNGIPQPASNPDRPLSRELLLNLLNIAFNTGELKYARRLCSSWLAVFPGDLQVNMMYARAFYKEKSTSIQLQALPIVEVCCNLDPEFLEAQQLLAEVQQLAGSSKSMVAKACANALSHGHPVKTGTNGHVSSWAKYVYEARSALSTVRAGDDQQYVKAEYFIHKALIENPDTPLAAVVHLQLIQSKGSMPKLAVRNLAQIYHERWPDCLQFLLSLSNELIGSGESDQAVSMLHLAVSKDISGQVPRRMWGENHPYATLWPAILEAHNTNPNSPQNIPIPAAVASILGWNQLAAANFEYNEPDPGQPVQTSERPQYDAFEVPQAQSVNLAHAAPIEIEPPQMSESSKGVQTELEKMAAELAVPHITHEDGRFPVYVIFTTQAGLQSQYGPGAFRAIDTQLKKLAEVVHGRKINQEFWGSLVFYADDPTCTGVYNLLPAPYNDAWKLKLILADLDKALEKKGERIGAVLIVGGPEIVPFHNLPNPVEDADIEVPSDSPFAAKDNNYFVSDWAVGRISAGSGTDPSVLLALVKDISNRYDQNARKLAWYRRIIQYIRERLKTGVSKRLSSFGYTAAVWRQASFSVFRPIGNPADLLISPPVHAVELPDPALVEAMTAPVTTKALPCLLMPDTRLAYFNLHGVPDSSEWYGQCDPTQPEAGPEFPIAMRPADIRNSGSAPHMVFTEACYGANIAGKTVDEAISLKFLASGTHALVGSTCISYGSLSTPLSSADLLGRVFWNLLQEGFTAGESLKRAKIHLTREMNQRQGFLDAEDQKTLISFVLFGDPLAQPFKTRVTPKISPHLSDAAVPVATVCERSCEGEAGSTVSLETISHLKSIVAQYLPGMGDAEVSLSHEHQRCSNSGGKCGCGKQCQFSRLASKHQPLGKPRRRVVTLSKNFEQAKLTHKQYARLTLDDKGNIVKMVVSH